MQNPPYTLVVVHMQGHLRAATDLSTIEAVKQLVNQARRDSAAIVFTWFPYYSSQDETPCPPPLQQLTELICGYERGTTLEHFGGDGSSMVLHACARKGWSTNYFRVCGVNTDMCVYDTACGLVNGSSRVEVWLRACNTTSREKDYTSQFNGSGVHLISS